MQLKTSEDPVWAENDANNKILEGSKFSKAKMNSKSELDHMLDKNFTSFSSDIDIYSGDSEKEPKETLFPERMKLASET